MRKINNLQKCFVALGIMIVLIFFSIRIHKLFDKNIESNIVNILDLITNILIFIDAVIVIVEFLSNRVSKKSESIFKDVIVNLKQKTKRYSKKCNNDVI